MRSDPDLLQYATAALDVHHHTALPEDPEPADRSELDALHAHTTAMYELLDTHTRTARETHPVQGDHLHAARTRLWQAAEHIHDAYHAAPLPGGRIPTPEECAARLPQGAPALTICQRHTSTAAPVRRQTTPTDLRTALPGLIRH